jgi:plasmid stabilization system protein ParE
VTRPVRLTPLARDDVRQIVRWYESQQKGLGTRLLQELRVSLADIGERAGSFPVAHRDMRRALLHRFPYGVFFFEDGEAIIVCGVLDLRRNPRTWRSRR